MSEKIVTLGTRIPKSLHDKVKADAKAAGLSLQDYIVDLIETRPEDVKSGGENELVELLTKPRTSDRFGDETIIEEILRRMISVQLVVTHNMVQAIGLEATKKVMDGLDAQADTVVQQR